MLIVPVTQMEQKQKINNEKIKMSKFLVKKPEVHIATYIVDANNADEAIRILKENYDDERCEEIVFEYSHTMDTDLWDVELYKA